MAPASGAPREHHASAVPSLTEADASTLRARLFLRDGAARIAALRTAQTTDDTRAMVKLAHSLKGSASSFGPGTLAARCGELQARAASADAAEDARLIDGVDAEFVLASAALRAELGPVAPPSTLRARRSSRR